jgi:hypothetical protein
MAALSSQKSGAAPSPSQLNDTFRRTLIGGRVVITSGVAVLGEEAVRLLVGKVATFETFDTGNDPYGEHDFGAIEHGGVRYFWKIDYYDRDYIHGSPDPADPAVTARVLTIMRAEEY